jgi:hypothetical protein
MFDLSTSRQSAGSPTADQMLATLNPSFETDAIKVIEF